MELALRTFAGNEYTEWHLPLFLTVELGTPREIGYLRAALGSQRLYAALPSIAINLLLILTGIWAFALYWSERSRREYLWLGLYLYMLGVSNLLVFCSATGVISLAWNNLLGDPLIYIFTIMQIQFTFSFAGKRVGKTWRAYEILLLAMLIPATLTTFAALSSSLYVLMEALAILPAALLLPALLFAWYHGGNREAGWLILPSLLPAATTAISDIGTVSIFTGWGHADFLANPIQFGSIPLQIADLGDLLFVLSIGVVMFFRFTRVTREQARSAAELEAGRNMQSLLVPTKPSSTPGFAVESVYVPASEVGGDFFQVLPACDGSLLIVVGDVSGKGLKAAMTVSTIVGALRNESSRQPSRVLANLNRLLYGQISGFVTCCAALIGADNELIIANAGHLAPYRNGNEIECEPVLPLGLIADGAYVESTLLLAPGDRLTFLSDGVVEAMNTGGELFGFDRTREISGQSAQIIAEAAQQFGQNDDITVLTLTLVGADTVHL
ncbi:MAG: SpoIIE family protein phosphatase [Acidobacteriaceae bacterium]